MITNYPRPYIHDTEIAIALTGSDDRRYSWVKRALQKGVLTRLKRGIYLLDQTSLDLFEIAQHFYGPSYISLESALSFHGWIPEAVYLVTSASAKRNAKFKTPVGLFTYERMPNEQFFMGVEPVTVDAAIYLMAHPWKALADMVYARRKQWENLDMVLEDLRIEKITVQESDKAPLKEIALYYHSPRVRRFAQQILQEL